MESENDWPLQVLAHRCAYTFAIIIRDSHRRLLWVAGLQKLLHNIMHAIYAHLNVKTSICVFYCACRTLCTRVYKCMHVSCSWKLYVRYKVSSTAWFTNHFVGFCNYGNNEAVHVVPTGWQPQATWLRHITRISAYFHHTSLFLGDHTILSIQVYNNMLKLALQCWKSSILFQSTYA